MAKSFVLTGDWDKLNNLFKGLKQAFDKAGKETLQKLAMEGEKFAVKAIKNQSLGWVPLDPKYLARKIGKGESNKIYVATSSYYQSITSWVSKGKGYVGVRRMVKERDSSGRYVKGGSQSNNLIADIANILEYGSPARGIPARPLWRPTAEFVAKFERDNKITRSKLHDELLFLLK